MQNIYDNDKFFTSYMDLRENGKGLNDILEIPAFRAMLPSIKNKVILDLGCGYGEASRWYTANGASQVIGVDISNNMIEKANNDFFDERIKYIHSPMENLSFEKESFDIIVSSLAFHYVEDFNSLIFNIYEFLRDDGYLVFSQEHPILLAKKVTDGWCKDNRGNRLHWIMDDYDEECVREHNWFIQGVIKYHRKISTILNTLIDTGFIIEKLDEPVVIKEVEERNERLKQERRRPPFIIIKARKKIL